MHYWVPCLLCSLHKWSFDCFIATRYTFGVSHLECVHKIYCIFKDLVFYKRYALMRTQLNELCVVLFTSIIQVPVMAVD